MIRSQHLPQVHADLINAKPGNRYSKMSFPEYDIWFRMRGAHAKDLVLPKYFYCDRGEVRGVIKLEIGEISSFLVMVANQFKTDSL